MSLWKSECCVYQGNEYTYIECLGIQCRMVAPRTVKKSVIAVASYSDLHAVPERHGGVFNVNSLFVPVIALCIALIALIAKTRPRYMSKKAGDADGIGSHVAPREVV